MGSRRQTISRIDHLRKLVDGPLAGLFGVARPSPIAAARELLGMTQGELAAHLGVSYVSISRWETGGRRPPVELVERLIEVVEEHLASEIVSEYLKNVALEEPNASTLAISEQRVRRRSRLLLRAKVLRQETRLSLNEWCDALGLAPRLLRDAEESIESGGRRYVSVFEVGWALEVSARGITGALGERSRWIGSNDHIAASLLGLVVRSVEREIQLLRSGVELLPPHLVRSAVQGEKRSPRDESS